MNQWLIVIGAILTALFGGWLYLSVKIRKLDSELDQNITGNRSHGLSDDERERKTLFRESLLRWHKLFIAVTILVLLISATVVIWPVLESSGLLK